MMTRHTQAIEGMHMRNRPLVWAFLAVALFVAVMAVLSMP